MPEVFDKVAGRDGPAETFPAGLYHHSESNRRYWKQMLRTDRTVNHLSEYQVIAVNRYAYIVAFINVVVRCRPQNIRQEPLLRGFAESRDRCPAVKFAEVLEFDDDVVVAQIPLSALGVECDAGLLLKSPDPREADFLSVSRSRGLVTHLQVSRTYFLCCRHAHS